MKIITNLFNKPSTSPDPPRPRPQPQQYLEIRYILNGKKNTTELKEVLHQEDLTGIDPNLCSITDLFKMIEEKRKTVSHVPDENKPSNAKTDIFDD